MTIHDEPHPSRMSPDDPQFEGVVAQHRAAREAGEFRYRDPKTGLFVFTAVHLSTRPCCGSGCRHCPYVWND